MMPFVPGQLYRRSEIHDAVGGQRYGGISTPAKHPMILLFTGDQGEQYGYHDEFRPDGTYLYTGEGQIGDMQMKGNNAAIRDHQILGKELHLFKSAERSVVRYVGSAVYLDHHERIAPDRDGNFRKVIVFELAVDVQASGVPGIEPDPPQRGIRKLWRQDFDQLREEAYRVDVSDRPATERKSVSYYRSELIKVYVLRRAEGRCEGCEQPAPFEGVKGEPYLEPHHVRRRADSGPDHPLWVIALCPNCHARVHRGKDGKQYNDSLEERVRQLESFAPAPALLAPAVSPFAALTV